MEDQGNAQLLEWASSKGIIDASLPSLSSSVSSVLQGCCLGTSLRISSFPHAGGRGLAAVRDIEDGELILRVPDEALMDVRSAKQDRVLAEALLRHPKLSSEQILTVHLLREVSKKSESQWFPYLLSLPRVHHCLANFSEEQAESLQVGDAVWTAKQAAKQVRQSWIEAQNLLKELGLQPRFPTFKAWLWAWATISSRTLHVPWDPAGTLCPVGDLFNYVPPGAKTLLASTGKKKSEQISVAEDKARSAVPKASSFIEDFESECEEVGGGLEFKDSLRDGGYEPEHHAFCFYARQQYKEGEQVLLCYGQYNNLELLEHYGFLLPDNPNDNVYVALPSPAELGNESDVSWIPEVRPEHLYLHVDGRPSFSLLSGLRQQAAPSMLRKSHGHLAKSGLQISIQGDLAVYGWLLRRCQSLLAELATNLAEDKHLLNIISSCGRTEGHHSFSSGLPIPSSPSAQAELQNYFKVLSDEDSRTRWRLERWKLALQWRLGYKEVLHSCITHCRRKSHQLQTSQGGVL